MAWVDIDIELSYFRSEQIRQIYLVERLYVIYVSENNDSNL